MTFTTKCHAYVVNNIKGKTARKLFTLAEIYATVACRKGVVSFCDYQASEGNHEAKARRSFFARPSTCACVWLRLVLFSHASIPPSPPTTLKKWHLFCKHTTNTLNHSKVCKIVVSQRKLRLAKWNFLCSISFFLNLKINIIKLFGLCHCLQEQKYNTN